MIKFSFKGKNVTGRFEHVSVEARSESHARMLLVQRGFQDLELQQDAGEVVVLKPRSKWWVRLGLLLGLCILVWVGAWAWHRHSSPPDMESLFARLDKDVNANDFAFYRECFSDKVSFYWPDKTVEDLPKDEYLDFTIDLRQEELKVYRVIKTRTEILGEAWKDDTYEVKARVYANYVLPSGKSERKKNDKVFRFQKEDRGWKIREVTKLIDGELGEKDEA